MKSIFYLLSSLLICSCVTTNYPISKNNGNSSSFINNTKNIASDAYLSSKIISKFVFNGLKNPGNSLDILVYEGRVLLTGIVDNSLIAKKAIDTAWSVNGVKEVIDEIQVITDRNIWKNIRLYMLDLNTTSQIMVRMLLTKNLSLDSVKLTTVNGITYLLGVSRDKNQVILITRLVATTQGVRKVVSHIILENDKRRKN